MRGSRCQVLPAEHRGPQLRYSFEQGTEDEATEQTTHQHGDICFAAQQQENTSNEA